MGAMNPQNVKWEIVQYTRGQGLAICVKPLQTFPPFILVQQENVRLFASQQMNFVFVSRNGDSNSSPKRCREEEFKEWWRIIKVNGYLCLHIGQDSQPMMEKCGAWDLVENEVCDDGS